MDAAIETIELTKRFGSTVALDACSIAMRRGEIFGLLGPNGAGKSTLLRLLMGFLYPTAGAGYVFGNDCCRQSLAVRRRVSYLPGDARLPRHMRARGVLEFFAGIHPAGDLQQSLAIAERLELDLTRRVAFMSTGMRQKAALAAVLGNQTELIILDEPTANLDPTVRGEVLNIIEEARQERGRTVVFSSHVLSEIEEACDAVGLLRQGKLAHQLRLDHLKQRHRIFAIYHGGVLHVPESLENEVQILSQDGHAVRLETAGDLAPLLGWLSTIGPERIRVEPVGLRSVYDAVHRDERIAADNTHEEAAA